MEPAVTLLDAEIQNYSLALDQRGELVLDLGHERIPQFCGNADRIVDEIAHCLPEKSHGRLHLDYRLPEFWHQITWEQLPLGNTLLGHRLQVIRRFNEDRWTIAKSKSLLLDRWTDERFISATQPHIASGKLCARRGRAVDSWLDATQDLSNFREVICVAHGSAGRYPLLTEEGKGWSIPFPSRLPELVWLMACEESEGRLDTLVKTSLIKGAKCVVCADGKLAAPRMLSILQSWLFGPQMPLVDWLFQLQIQDSTNGGADSLQIFGSPPQHP